MKNIAVMVSGGGTNLQALIDSQNAGEIVNGKITLVVASNQKAYAIERARENGIKTEVVAKKEFLSEMEWGGRFISLLDEYKIDLIVLAGYLSILPEGVTTAFANRIINIHPALIPSFCGKGFYGLHVHEEVLKYGVKLTGATVHFVNEIVDGGAIILQKGVEVLEGDTPETLQRRVMEQGEWQLLPKAVSLFCQDKIKVIENRAIISE